MQGSQNPLIQRAGTTMNPATRTRSLAPTLGALALTAFAAFALAATSAHADVYKWTDANGTTQYSDAAPGPAQRVILHDNKTTPLGDAPLTPRPETLTPRPTTSGPGYTPPPPAPTRSDRLAAYHASQECFAPFRNANGSVQAQAYTVCTELKDPNGEQVR
jgi:hypothetical protein